jgi:hypothetical protein
MLACNGDAPLICDDRNLLGSKRVLPPDWGARGARLFRGQASFGYVSIGSKLLIVRSRYSSALRGFAGPSPVDDVQSGRPLALERKPSLAAIWEQRPRVRWGGGTLEKGKDQSSPACDSVAPDPGDPRAERLLGQRPGQGAAKLSRPWQCQRHRTFGRQRSMAAGSSTMSVSVLRSCCGRTSRSRPFSGSPPARRLIDSAPPPLVTACGKGTGILGASLSTTKAVQESRKTDQMKGREKQAVGTLTGSKRLESEARLVVAVARSSRGSNTVRTRARGSPTRPGTRVKRLLTRSRSPGIQSNSDAPRIPALFSEYRERIRLLWYR